MCTFNFSYAILGFIEFLFIIIAFRAIYGEEYSDRIPVSKYCRSTNRTFKLFTLGGINIIQDNSDDGNGTINSFVSSD